MKKRKVQVVIFGRKDKTSPVNKILLLQTNKKRGGFWQNITGKVEKGERYQHAALREFAEETGLRIKQVERLLDLKLEHKFKSKNGYPVTEKSFVFIIPICKISIDPKEHQKYKWKNLHSVKLKNYGYPSNFESFQYAKKALKKLSN